MDHIWTIWTNCICWDCRGSLQTATGFNSSSSGGWGWGMGNQDHPQLIRISALPCLVHPSASPPYEQQVKGIPSNGHSPSLISLHSPPYGSSATSYSHSFKFIFIHSALANLVNLCPLPPPSLNVGFLIFYIWLIKYQYAQILTLLPP